MVGGTTLGAVPLTHIIMKLYQTSTNLLYAIAFIFLSDARGKEL